MLKFYDYNVTNCLEVPNEVCLNFHISNCQNRCSECFSPHLWKDIGSNLLKYSTDLILAYSKRITCVCFLGEGKNTFEEHNEFKIMCDRVHKYGFKTCLYCGRDCQIEDWQTCFDYIKIGSYNKILGDLSYPTTNQKLFKKIDDKYIDITYLFWEENIY